ncbi:MAG: AAA family ATPase [Terriglobia bacterium]|jgi:predicted ATPase
MSDTIKRITIEGFKSIRKLESFELRPLNVLIGANGAGKTNFVEFFRLLRELVEQRLQLAVGKLGGADACLYMGPKITRRLVGKLDFGTNGYELALVPTADNRLIFDRERAVYHQGGLTGETYLPGSFEASLKDHRKDASYSGAKRGVPFYAYRAVSGWVVYHFHDTSPEAGVRRQGAINDNGYLRSNAENLAAFLHGLQRTHAANYNRIRDVVRLAAPFFDDFNLRPVVDKPELIQLEWLQKDSDYPFRPSQLSDGTLRFICLATALLQPRPPATMLFDEPELGAHPFALTLLANLFQQAAKHPSQQVIVSTQSAQLVNEFEPEDVIVVERTQGESVFRRLESAKLSGWLEDYTLGELWQKNVFGGGPRNEAMPIMPDDEGNSPAVPEAKGMNTGDERP